MELEQTKAKNKEEIESHDHDIASWEAQIKELQAKISGVKKRKDEILKFDDSSMANELDFGLEFVKKAQTLEEELTTLQSKRSLGEKC